MEIIPQNPKRTALSFLRTVVVAGLLCFATGTGAGAQDLGTQSSQLSQTEAGGLMTSAKPSRAAATDSCTGCYDEKGRCVLGYDALRCGGNGIICERCYAGEVCDPRDRTCRRCSIATCPDGCCDPMYGCMPGINPYACGTGAKACTACIKPLGIKGKEFCPDGKCVCVQGKCETCSAATCSGCCADGRCESSNRDQSCGAKCENCTLQGKICSDGKCVACGPKTCNGCCTKFGTCEQGSGLFSCGGNGGTCADCTTLSLKSPICLNGQCVECNGTTCPNGCCDSSYGCVPKDEQGDPSVLGTKNPGCGQTGGASCKYCPFTQVCVNGKCEACNATNCPNGCCDSVSGCVSGYEWIHCGPPKTKCVSCTLQQICSADRKCVDKPVPANGAVDATAQ